MNKNLHKAKTAKNDEFYTLREDIDKELQYYESHFAGKVVYCNCDTEESNFYKYFVDNYDRLGLAGLLRMNYDSKTGDGDFRGEESIELLKQADIVVTNPPFSLFREYIAQLMEYEKKFIIVGNKNAIINKEIFPLVKDNKIWFGYTGPNEFALPGGKLTKKVNGLCRWFTNLKHKKRNEDLILYKKYTKKDYPKYDNYDAIEVSKVKDIPVDYDGAMGVPVTFLDKYNPTQFEIVWQAAGNTRACAPEDILKRLGYKQHKEDRGGVPVINGKRKYTRILIKKRKK